MSTKHSLQRTLINILKHNRDGSFATQASRGQILMCFAEDLTSLGYRLDNVYGLKQKHIIATVKYWQQKQLSVSTIKNRLAALRNLCNKINKATIIPTNDSLDIGRRQYTPKINRAIFNPDFSKISNPHIYISLQLQRLFGLRREEALKIKPFLADKGDKLELQPAWCKGGRGRFIPIRTEEQRYWINCAKKIAEVPSNSLIPENKSYIRHRHVYDKQVIRAGLRNLHGLRHAYAQQRYKEMTGWEAPINGGPKLKELTPEQRKIDLHARMILTEELGHSREQITVNYLGR